MITHVAIELKNLSREELADLLYRAFMGEIDLVDKNYDPRYVSIYSSLNYVIDYIKANHSAKSLVDDAIYDLLGRFVAKQYPKYVSIRTLEDYLAKLIFVAREANLEKSIDIILDENGVSKTFSNYSSYNLLMEKNAMFKLAIEHFFVLQAQIKYFKITQEQCDKLFKDSTVMYEYKMIKGIIDRRINWIAMNFGKFLETPIEAWQWRYANFCQLELNGHFDEKIFRDTVGIVLINGKETKMNIPIRFLWEPFDFNDAKFYDAILRKSSVATMH